jgi:ABC-2 type transport system permease protein
MTASNNTRIFFVGGVIAYRALFNWLNPWIFVPTLIVTPVFQLLFFAFLGRAAGLEDDRFYVIGNALQVGALPGLFAMTFAIAGERWFQTLSPVLATPANRAAIFLGRALPVVANAAFVCVVTFVAGALILHVHIPASAYPTLAVVIAVTAISCTGFGFLGGPLGLRWRDAIIAINLADAVLLIFCGVNIPIASLPGWMQTVSEYLPVTHGLRAARRVADGASLSDVRGLLAAELTIGLTYAALGFLWLRRLEFAARRGATLENT